MRIQKLSYSERKQDSNFSSRVIKLKDAELINNLVLPAELNEKQPVPLRKKLIELWENNVITINQINNMFKKLGDNEVILNFEEKNRIESGNKYSISRKIYSFIKNAVAMDKDELGKMVKMMQEESNIYQEQSNTYHKKVVNLLNVFGF